MDISKAADSIPGSEPVTDGILCVPGRPDLLVSIGLDDFDAFWYGLVRRSAQPPAWFSNDDPQGGLVIPVGDTIIRVEGVARVAVLPVRAEHVHDRRTLRLNAAWRLVTCTRCQLP